jgi:hypothetical protein
MNLFFEVHVVFKAMSDATLLHLCRHELFPVVKAIIKA